MTIGVNINPASDVYNGGWAVQGANTSLWATLASSADTNFIESPASKERAIVAFPQNTTAVPAGANIQSVSVVVRASLGSGTATAGIPPSLSVTLLSGADNNHSKHRTIYPTNVSTSPQNFTVATWSNDPDGDEWDINGLNNVWLQISSSNQIVDLVRVYEAYLVVNYSGAPLVTITSPAGTVTTASPTVSWVWSQGEGERQSSVEYLVYTTAEVIDPTFTPGGDSPAYAPVFVGSSNGPATSVTLPGSLPSGSYWLYLQAQSSRGALSNWAAKQFTVYTPYPGTPSVQGPAGSPGTQGIASLVPDDANGCAVITVQDTSNLLGRHMSDVNIEDADQAWVTSNCTIASSTDFTFPGSIDQVWKITCTSAGNMSVTTGFAPVTAVGGQLTAVAQSLAATTGRNVGVTITYFDSNYNALSQVVGVATSDSTTWTQVGVVDPNIPSGVAKAQATFTFSSCALNEVHYITHAGILYGNSTQWSNGGMVSRNLLDSWYSNNSGTAPSGDAWVPSAGTTVSSVSAPTNSGYDGNTVNAMTCASVSPSIALRAAGTVFSTATAGTSFTLNKPTGTATGDLMLAFVTATVAQTGFVPPTGWTLVDTAKAADGSGHAITLIVMARTATSSEPTTWSGTLPVSSARCSAVVVGYSGAASITSQFIAEAQSATAVAGTAFTSQTVTNTDPGAWRVSAFATDTTGSSATMTANTQPAGGYAIQYVSAASWATINSSTSYTIDRPAGVVSGDLMIAVVTADVQGGISITAPTGWTVVRSVAGAGSWTAATVVLKRTAGSSEPATWTGTVSSSPGGQFQKASSCAAYRNAAPASSQFVADGYATSGVGYPTLWSPSVANTNANAWAVGAFSTLNDGSDGQNVLSARSSSGLNMQQRASESFDPGDEEDVICTLIEDSGAPVAPGSYAASSRATVWTASAFAWIGYILPATPGSPPSNETSRASNTAGSANPWDNLGVFDSAAAVATGPQSVSMTSSASFAAAAGWIGLLKPSSSSTGGLVSVSLTSAIDISQADPAALAAADNAVVIGASVIGSSGGNLLVTAEFFRASVPISSVTLPGGAFQSTSGGVYQDCYAQFQVPDGTTQINMQLSVAGRSVGDVVYWNRSFLNLGSDPSYVPGSAAASHPIWSYPEIQYSQDDGSGGGFGPWLDVPGTQTNLPAFGTGRYLVLRDHTIVPLLSRKYRARTVSYGLNGDTFVSPWGPDSVPMTFTATNWWLKDIDNPDNNIALKVKAQDLPVTKQASTVQFQGLGDPYPVVLTDGYKSETLPLSLIPVNQGDHAMLMAMLTSGKTLFLQSDIDQAWWVQILGDIKNTVLNTGQRQTNPLRQLDVTFLEVAPVP